MNKRRKYLEKKWYEFAGKDLVVEGYLPNGEMACDDDVLDFIEEFLQQEIERARKEVIVDLIKEVEDAHCDSVSLDLLREMSLSKFKDSKNEKDYGD